MTDSNKPPSREEFKRLREIVAAQSEVIEEYLPDDPQKRRFLGEAAKGIGAVGALGIAGQSGYAIGEASAEASTSDSDVDIGSPNNRHDAFLEGVDANSVSTDNLSLAGRAIDSILVGESTGLREEHGTVSHADPGTASDGTWNSSTFDQISISFTTAFSSTPVAIAGTSTGAGSESAKNISTTGADLIYRNYQSAGSTGPVGQWLAVGPE